MKSRAFHISKSLSLQSEHIEKPQILYILYIIWGCVRLTIINKSYLFYKNERKHCETRATFTNHRPRCRRLL